MSSRQDEEIAIFSLPVLVERALVQVGRGTLGYAFARENEALVCVHKDRRVARLDLASGELLSSFATGAGSECAQFPG